MAKKFYYVGNEFRVISNIHNMSQTNDRHFVSLSVIDDSISCQELKPALFPTNILKILDLIIFGF